MNMKKLVLGTLCAGCAAIILTADIKADSEEFVRDEYGLLSSDEVQELSEYGAELYQDRQCGVYLRITNDLAGYTYAQDYVENVYVVEELGYGNDHAGVLFLVSMKEHDYALTVYGSAYDVFTDPVVDDMLEDVVSHLSSGNWYQAFRTYYEESDRILENYTYHEIEYNTDDNIIIDGPGTDPEPEPGRRGVNPLPVGIGSVVTSLMICLGLRSKNKTTGVQHTAGTYLNHVQLTKKLDIFTHNTVSRMRVADSSNHNRPGGGIQTNYHSSGFHTHSGKF
jgi:uncharacterized protein